MYYPMSPHDPYYQQQQQQRDGFPMPSPPMSMFMNQGSGAGMGAGFPAWMGGSGGAGGGAMGAAGPAALFAALIAAGKMAEYDNPNSIQGKASLGLLGPSFNQIKEDPKGVGLPTALGVPFLAPFTGSDKARAAKPEWAGAMGKGGA